MGGIIHSHSVENVVELTEENSIVRLRPHTVHVHDDGVIPIPIILVWVWPILHEYSHYVLQFLLACRLKKASSGGTESSLLLLVRTFVSH